MAHYSTEERAVFRAMRERGVNPTGAYWCQDCGEAPRAEGSTRCPDCERDHVASIDCDS